MIFNILKNIHSLEGIDFAGVVVNKVKDVDDFKMVYEEI